MNRFKDLSLPICVALTQPSTLGGVSKEAFILNIMGALIFTVPLKLYYMSIVFIIIHFALVKICKKDALILTIFLKDYMKQKDYLNEF